MDIALNGDQRMMVDAAQKLNDKFVEPLIEHMSELGLTSVRTPEKDGGTGLNLLDRGLMMEQLPPAVMLIVPPHEATTTRSHIGGTPEQRERFVPDLIAGRKTGCTGGTGSTEPDHGSDPRGTKTTATPLGDHVLVCGRQQWISDAPVCDVINVTCRIPDGAGGFRIGRVLVDREESPFEVRELQMHGQCQVPLGEVVLDACKAPGANVCPDTADTAKLLTITWLANRPTVGLMSVGQANRALKMACEYAGLHKQFGKPIGAFQAIQNDPAGVVESSDAGFTAERDIARMEDNGFARDLKPARLAQVTRTIALRDLPDAFDDFIAGKVKGHTVVRVAH